MFDHNWCAYNWYSVVIDKIWFPSKFPMLRIYAQLLWLIRLLLKILLSARIKSSLIIVLCASRAHKKITSLFKLFTKCLVRSWCTSKRERTGVAGRVWQIRRNEQEDHWRHYKLPKGKAELISTRSRCWWVEGAATSSHSSDSRHYTHTPHSCTTSQKATLTAFAGLSKSWLIHRRSNFILMLLYVRSYSFIFYSYMYSEMNHYNVSLNQMSVCN